MIIPNIWENKKWQPNHQPGYHFMGDMTVSVSPSRYDSEQVDVDSSKLLAPLVREYGYW